MKKAKGKSAPKPAKARKIPASFWTDRAAKIAKSRAANEKAGLTERQRRAQRKAEREQLAAAQKSAQKAVKKSGGASPSSAPRIVHGLADAALPESARPKGLPRPGRRTRTPAPKAIAPRPTPPPSSPSTPDRDETIVVTGRRPGARRPRAGKEAQP